MLSFYLKAPRMFEDALLTVAFGLQTVSSPMLVRGHSFPEDPAPTYSS